MKMKKKARKYRTTTVLFGFAAVLNLFGAVALFFQHKPLDGVFGSIFGILCAMWFCDSIDTDISRYKRNNDLENERREENAGDPPED